MGERQRERERERAREQGTNNIHQLASVVQRSVCVVIAALQCDSSSSVWQGSVKTFSNKAILLLRQTHHYTSPSQSLPADRSTQQYNTQKELGGRKKKKHLRNKKSIHTCGKKTECYIVVIQ